MNDPHFQEKASKILEALKKASHILQKRIGGIFKGFVVISLLGVIIIGFVESDWSHLWTILGYIGVCTLVAIPLIGISWVMSKIGSSDTYTAIEGMFYSLKNKVCPIINWKETNQNS